MNFQLVYVEIFPSVENKVDSELWSLANKQLAPPSLGQLQIVIKYCWSNSVFVNIVPTNIS